VDLEAQLGQDIAGAVDADNRQRIQNNDIPTARQLNKRLSRWRIIDKNHLEIIKYYNYKWLWMLLVILGLVWLFFR